MYGLYSREASNQDQPMMARVRYVIIFKKEKGNTFTLLIIFAVKSLQKEQNNTILLL